MLNSKKSQFLIISGMFLLLLLVFIYSLETDNSYIVKPMKFSILNNIKYEGCMVAKLSNGSNIDNYLNSFSEDVYNYCNLRNIFCNLSIFKKVGAPTNLSLLNYTHYNYSIIYSNDGYNFSGDFNC